MVAGKCSLSSFFLKAEAYLGPLANLRLYCSYYGMALLGAVGEEYGLSMVSPIEATVGYSHEDVYCSLAGIFQQGAGDETDFISVQKTNPAILGV